MHPAERSGAESAFVVFVDKLIVLIASLAPEAESRDTQIFQEKLEEYRRVVTDPTRHMEVPRVTEACIATVQHYFRLSRKYHTDREAEFTEIISILRDAAKVSVSDNTDFNAQVVASSERFGRLVHVDDVRVLKQTLITEVQALRQVVEEKQKRDERAYQQLTSRVETLQAQLEEVEEEASLDGLTRIANRGRFQRTYARMLEQAREKGTPLSLAMLDVDNFKSINDTHGHPIGDRVLVCAAQWLTKSLRQTDFVARYGGEEFLLLLPETDLDGARGMVRRIRDQMASAGLGELHLGVRCRLTAGVALFPHPGVHKPEDLFALVEGALLEGKRQDVDRIGVAA